MIRALARFTGPDDRIALFADSAWGVAAEPRRSSNTPIDWAWSNDAPARRWPSTIRLHANRRRRLRPDRLDRRPLASAPAGPRPLRRPRLRALRGGRRLVTDTGVYEYRPGERRDRARATASHATLRFDGQEQSEVWAAHRWAGARASSRRDRSGLRGARRWGWSAALRYAFVASSARAGNRRSGHRPGGHAVEGRLPLAGLERRARGRARARATPTAPSSRSSSKAGSPGRSNARPSIRRSTRSSGACSSVGASAARGALRFRRAGTLSPAEERFDAGLVEDFDAELRGLLELAAGGFPATR